MNGSEAYLNTVKLFYSDFNDDKLIVLISSLRLGKNTTVLFNAGVGKSLLRSIGHVENFLRTP